MTLHDSSSAILRLRSFHFQRTWFMIVTVRLQPFVEGWTSIALKQLYKHELRLEIAWLHKKNEYREVDREEKKI